MGKIILRDLIIYGYHGCFEEENKIGGNYKIDIWVEGDFIKAEQTDELSDTVDYVALADIAAKEMLIPSKLIEHVAQRIISNILSNWEKIKVAGVSVRKMSPPMNRNVKSVEYTIEQRQ
jgi:dihydroneopterin aldolase